MLLLTTEISWMKSLVCGDLYSKLYIGLSKSLQLLRNIVISVTCQNVFQSSPKCWWQEVKREKKRWVKEAEALKSGGVWSWWREGNWSHLMSSLNGVLIGRAVWIGSWPESACTKEGTVRQCWGRGLLYSQPLLPNRGEKKRKELKREWEKADEEADGLCRGGWG